MVNKIGLCVQNVLFSALSGWALRMVATKRASEVCENKYMRSLRGKINIQNKGLDELIGIRSVFILPLFYCISRMTRFPIRS